MFGICTVKERSTAVSSNEALNMLVASCKHEGETWVVSQVMQVWNLEEVLQQWQEFP